MCLQSVKFNDFDDNVTKWLCILIYTYIYKYDYVMDFNLMVMLHSTMGFYGRLMIEVAYGKTIFHFTEGVQKMVAQEEWLGCWHNASSMFDISGSTSVWAQYRYIFFRFQRYKNLYVLCFQIYMYYKRILVDSDLVLTR